MIKAKNWALTSAAATALAAGTVGNNMTPDFAAVYDVTASSTGHDLNSDLETDLVFPVVSHSTVRLRNKLKKEVDAQIDAGLADKTTNEEIRSALDDYINEKLTNISKLLNV